MDENYMDFGAFNMTKLEEFKKKRREEQKAEAQNNGHHSRTHVPLPKSRPEWQHPKAFLKENGKNPLLRKIVSESIGDGLYHHFSPEKGDKYVNSLKDISIEEILEQHNLFDNIWLLPSSVNEGYGKDRWKEKFGSSRMDEEIKRKIDALPYEVLRATDGEVFTHMIHLRTKVDDRNEMDDPFLRDEFYRNVILNVINEAEKAPNRFEMDKNFGDLGEKVDKTNARMNDGFKSTEEWARSIKTDVNGFKEETRGVQKGIDAIRLDGKETQAYIQRASGVVSSQIKELDEMIRMQVEEKKIKERYKMIRTTISMAGEGVSAVLSLCGEHKLAAQAGTLFNAGVKITESIQMLAGGFSMGGVVGMVSAAAMVASLFQDEGPDPTMEALVAIHQELINTRRIILERIDIMHKDIVKRLNNLSDQIEDSTMEILKAIERSNTNLWDFKVPTMYSLARLQGDLRMMESILGGKLDHMVIQKFRVAFDNANMLINRSGIVLKKREYKELISIAKGLERGVRGITPSHACVNGSLCIDTTPRFLGKMLNNGPEDALGYLALHASRVDDTFPKLESHHPQNVTNPIVYCTGVSRYIGVRTMLKNLDYDDRGEILSLMIKEGQDLLSVLDSLLKSDKQFDHVEKISNGALYRMGDIISNSSTEVERRILDEVKENFSRMNKALAIEIREECQKPVTMGIQQFRTWYDNYMKICIDELERPYNDVNTINIFINDSILEVVHKPLVSGSTLLPLARFAMPAKVNYKHPYRFLPLPLKTFVKRSELANIPMIYILLERLGLGYLTFEYKYMDEHSWTLRSSCGSRIDPISPNNSIFAFVLEVSYVENVDNVRKSIRILSMIYEGKVNEADNCHQKLMYNHSKTIFSNDPARNSSYVEMGMISVHSVWTSSAQCKNKSILGYLYGAHQAEVSPTIIRHRNIAMEFVLKKRREIVEQLLAVGGQSNALGTAFTSALEELDGSYALVVAIGHMMGFTPAQMLLIKDIVNQGVATRFYENWHVNTNNKLPEMDQLHRQFEKAYGIVKGIRNSCVGMLPDCSPLRTCVQKQVDNLILFKKAFEEEGVNNPRKPIRDKNKGVQEELESLRESNRELQETNRKLLEKMNLVLQKIEQL